MVNKGKFVERLKEVTNRDESECIIINDILESHFLIGVNNKEKMMKDFKEKLNINDEEASKLYNICMETVVKGIFKR